MNKWMVVPIDEKGKLITDDIIFQFNAHNPIKFVKKNICLFKDYFKREEAGRQWNGFAFTPVPAQNDIFRLPNLDKFHKVNYSKGREN